MNLQQVAEDLQQYSLNVYSQHGEDGILDEIFHRIGAENNWCFECGAADGLLFSNTRRLIEHGWTGVLVEADPVIYNRLVENNESFRDRTHCVHELLTDVDKLLARFSTPKTLDLAVIDIDGQDFYLWNAMLKYRPRVVVIEFDYLVDPEFIPTRGGKGQAGVAAIHKLGCGKYYTPVWRGQANVIFVASGLEEKVCGAL